MFVSAGMLLVHNLVPDVVAAFLLWTCPGWKEKATAVIILIEAFAAILVGFLAFFLLDYVGPLDSFLLCVGVIFIHEVDEVVDSGTRMLLTAYQLRGRWPLEKRFYYFCVSFFVVATFIS